MKDQRIQTIEEFLLSFDTLMDAQPPASELDLCDEFLRDVNSLYARWSMINGLASTMIAVMKRDVIDKTDDETFKRFKGSSTLTTEYALGKYNSDHVAILLRAQTIGYVLKTTAENYRTLISSYRSVLAMEKSTTIRQTVQ